LKVATKDPRSLAVPGNAWITDSRAYNLIWLGRWLERTSGLVHTLEASARAADGDASFADACAVIALAWDVTGEPAAVLPQLLAECLRFTRDDATHVAPLELLQKLNALVEDLPVIWASSNDRAETLAAMEILGERLDEIAAEVENRWFRRLSE
jgi:hypothetical protein